MTEAVNLPPLPVLPASNAERVLWVRWATQAVLAERERGSEAERKAALWDAINMLWSFPGKTLEEVVRQVADEMAIRKGD